MLKLRRHTPRLRVHQRRIIRDQPFLDQRVQCQQVVLLACAVEISAAEGEGAKILLDGFEEGAGGLMVEGVAFGLGLGEAVV